MLRQRRVLQEPLPALGAHVRLLAAVRRHVSQPRHGVRERLAARVALEAPLPGVHVRVAVQRAPVAEPARAHRARVHVRGAAMQGDLVSVQPRPAMVAAAAVVARERRFGGVLVAGVRHEAVLRPVRLAALDTRPDGGVTSAARRRRRARGHVALHRLPYETHI